MRVLITGGNGFVGVYLNDYLSRHPDYDEVIVSSRRVTDNAIKLNLLDIEETKKVLSEYKFDKIFHLTAQSSVRISFTLPFDTIYDNINTTVNLLKAVRDLKLNTKVVLASTSEIYQVSDKELTEDSGFSPRNPYAISKIVTDYLVRSIAKDNNINVTLLRLFNHIGPRQSDTFVMGSFSKQLAEIKLGLRDPIIEVGNLEAKRDFIDVRDVVKAYDKVSNDEEICGVYNVCSGNAYQISYLLDKLIEISKLDVEIKVDPRRLRKVDIPIFVGSYEKIKNKFGWEPQINIEKTLKDMFEYWLDKLRT